MNKLQWRLIQERNSCNLTLEKRPSNDSVWEFHCFVKDITQAEKIIGLDRLKKEKEKTEIIKEWL
jgi:hypothetical protein